MKLPAFRNTQVVEIIKQAIDLYLNDPQFDKALVRYPNHIQGINKFLVLDAYEIRMPDDDDSGKADMGFAAIEKSRSILST